MIGLYMVQESAHGAQYHLPAGDVTVKRGLVPGLVSCYEVTLTHECVTVTHTYCFQLSVHWRVCAAQIKESLILRVQSSGKVILQEGKSVQCIMSDVVNVHGFILLSRDVFWQVGKKLTFPEKAMLYCETPLILLCLACMAEHQGLFVLHRFYIFH